MKRVYKILAYQAKILELCNSEYQYIDDIAITCYAARFSTKAQQGNFRHALDDLIACGRLICIGNRVKLSI